MMRIPFVKMRMEFRHVSGMLSGIMVRMHKLLMKNIEQMTGECSECGVVRIYKDQHRNPNGNISYYYRCETAVKKKTERNTRRRNTHGLTQIEAREFVKNKSCEICGSTKSLCVDHCHNSNRIRGVLCRDCNIALGILKDDTERLQNAIAYLMRDV